MIPARPCRFKERNAKLDRGPSYYKYLVFLWKTTGRRGFVATFTAPGEYDLPTTSSNYPITRLSNYQIQNPIRTAAARTLRRYCLAAR
jgi:hypothetical protein